MKRTRTFLSLVSGSVLLGAMGVAYASGLRFNTTASMPVGIWHVAPTSGSLRHGQIVTVCLPQGPVVRLGVMRGYIHTGSCPDGLEPLIKPVVAVAGDVVTVRPDGLAVNGIALFGTRQLPEDSVRRALPAFPAGVYTVTAKSVWLVSIYNARSFDSRYFGPVRTSDVAAIAEPVWVAR